MSREVIASSEVPAAVGPYGQAIRAGGLLYCSGQLPLDPEVQKPMGEDLGAQTRRCLSNLAAVCRAAGAAPEEAVRLTVYATRMGQFAEINAAYAEFFTGQPPARAAVGVAALPRGAQIEIDAIAIVPDEEAGQHR